MNSYDEPQHNDITKVSKGTKRVPVNEENFAFNLVYSENSIFYDIYLYYAENKI